MSPGPPMTLGAAATAGLRLTGEVQRLPTCHQYNVAPLEIVNNSGEINDWRTG
jgi:hypothetical protein